MPTFPILNINQDNDVCIILVRHFVPPVRFINYGRTVPNLASTFNSNQSKIVIEAGFPTLRLIPSNYFPTLR